MIVNAAKIETRETRWIETLALKKVSSLFDKRSRSEIRNEKYTHGHFILRERSCFVTADNSGASQCFDSREMLHHAVLVC